VLLLLAALACWAPDRDPAPPDPAGAVADGAPSLDLPDPPFTAWTRTAPLTLVGPGGAGVAQLSQPGVELEVLQVLPVRVRVRCTGCAPPDDGVEGWLQAGAITTERPPGAGG